jgi:hypothetical protein
VGWVIFSANSLQTYLDTFFNRQFGSRKKPEKTPKKLLARLPLNSEFVFFDFLLPIHCSRCSANVPTTLRSFDNDKITNYADFIITSSQLGQCCVLSDILSLFPQLV